MKYLEIKVKCSTSTGSNLKITVGPLGIPRPMCPDDCEICGPKEKLKVSCECMKGRK